MIDPAVKVALIAAIPPTLLGVVTLILGIASRGKLRDIHLEINSRLSQLLKARGQAARAQGHREGLKASGPGTFKHPKEKRRAR